MRKLIGLFFALSLTAVTAPAFDGEDEFVPPTVQTQDGAYRRLHFLCPRGYERIPRWHWNVKRHRWEFAGFTCRRKRPPQREGRNGGGKPGGGFP